MSGNRPAPAYNPLEQFKLENEEGFITQLNMFQVYKPPHSLDDIAMAIVSHYSDKCSATRGHDVHLIFRYLKDNPNCRNNDYAHWAKLAEDDKYGDEIPKVQAVLRELDFAIEQAKRQVRMWGR